MKVGIAGMGAIGLKVAQALDRGDIPGFSLAGFCARTDVRGAEFNATLSSPVAQYALRTSPTTASLFLRACRRECLKTSRALFWQQAKP